MSIYDSGNKDLIEISTVAGIINPFAAQVDAALWGSLGLGNLQADLSARLDAAIQANADIALNMNPFVGFQMALAALAQLQVQIEAALSGGIVFGATAQIGANAALIADLELRLGGLNALLEAVLKVKIPAIQFVAGLDVGPVRLVAWEDMPNSEMVGKISTVLDDVASGSNTYGVLLVTKTPAAWVGISSMFNTT